LAPGYENISLEKLKMKMLEVPLVTISGRNFKLSNLEDVVIELIIEQTIDWII